ncbi:MAG: nucleotide pyrophosphohydrolase [archaeon]
MSLRDVQKDVDDFTSQFKPQYWKPHEVLARLIEETGELAREINDVYGPKRKKVNEADVKIDDEIADILFTLCCLANPLKIDLQDSWDKMMDKCRNRDKDRYVKR